ncbi:MAG: pyridoxal phosphate-dependent aminotransferase [Acidimicrobiia bacterium]|jgi:aspartate/methionine/tyrosine aminotransferase
MARRMSRLGTETAFDVLARAQRMREEGKPVINLGIGSPDFRTSEDIVEAGIDALHDGYHFYTPAKGLPEVRAAVAEDIRARHGVLADPERVLIVPGGKPTMFFAILMLGEPGIEIMYPDPGFPIYRSMIEFSGATPVPIELHEETGFGFDSGEVLAKITDATRLIILNSPANPTGGVVARDQIDSLVAGLDDHPETYVLSDEIYSRIVYDDLDHVSLLTYESLRDRLIVLDGWSKTYSMTGWRLGWGLWPPSLIDGAERLQINSTSCASAPVQMAGLAALTGRQDHVSDMVTAFDERRRFVHDGLNRISGFRCVLPKGAFYVFPNITGTGLTSQQVETRLLEEASVAVVSGTSFGRLGEGYIRLSYAASMDELREAIERIGALFGTR